MTCKIDVMRRLQITKTMQMTKIKKTIIMMTIRKIIGKMKKDKLS